MIESAEFSTKRILVVDRHVKNTNDRTWCFWEKETGYFEEIVHKHWQSLQFVGDNGSIPLDIKPYSYKMIRGIDFYNFCFKKIESQPNITVVYGDITFDRSNGDTPSVNGISLNTSGAIIFNSIYQPLEEEKNSYNLKQHFKGWIVETLDPCFDPEKATIMDFRVDQSRGTTFVYVLPLTSTRALVEYTAFNKTVLTSEEYDSELRDYVGTFISCQQYKVVEQEMGVIPMTSARFHGYKNGMYNIGTAGGRTKASTGYTFRFIQKHAEGIVARMIKSEPPVVPNSGKSRFAFYDNTLLHILSGNKLSGKQIFEMLFKKNKASRVFRFLDNETSIPEELKIISTLPTRVFARAGITEFCKLLF